MMINFLIFILSFYIFLISTIGYGILFNSFCFEKKQSFENGNSIYLGFYGLFLVTIISLFTSLFYPHDFFHNSLLHGVGILSFIFSNSKNRKEYLKSILIISICVFSALIISKTNDDLSYYHLPFTKYLTENKIIFGMGHLNHGYNLLSSLFFYNSTLYLPIINYFSFHFGILYFLIFFIFFIFKEVTSNKSNDLVRLLYIFAFTFFTLSFNRIAEYGTDKPGQLLIVILILKTLQIVCFDKNNKIKNILYLIPLLAYCITLKTYFIPYVIIGFVIFILNFKVFFILKKIVLSKSFAFFLTAFFLYFLHHFISTGCIISPLPYTCFGNNLSWARQDIDMINLSIWLEQWAKAGAGPNFRVENVSQYIESFNWFKNWLDKYFFNKFLDQLLILFSSYIVIFLIFKKFKFNKDRFRLNKKIFIFYSIIFFIFFIWFYNHPTLRYGGYAIVFLIISLPIAVLFSKFKNQINFEKRKIYLILIVLIIFNFKNLSRIQNEFNKENSNFPFYLIKEKDYVKYEFNDNMTIFSAHHCWLTPTPCGNIDDKIYVEKINGYFFIKKLK